MVKNVIKEIFIMLLLFAAIILVLAVMFYDYNPINKNIPTPLTYKLPNDLSGVKEELETTLITQEEQVIKIYELTEDELNFQKKVNYEPGKANPFEVDSTDSNDNTISNTISNNSSIKGNTTNSGSTGSFFEDGSTK